MSIRVQRSLPFAVGLLSIFPLVVRRPRDQRDSLHPGARPVARRDLAVQARAGRRISRARFGSAASHGRSFCQRQLEPFQTLKYHEDAAWKELNVPGNWEMAGFSPATYNQPDNAIGMYRLEFEVPADWKGRVVKLNFDGVQNAAEVYLTASRSTSMSRAKVGPIITRAAGTPSRRT